MARPQPRSGLLPQSTGRDGRAFAYYQRLRRLEQFVERNYDEPITLRSAAAVAGLEQTYFSRFFHDKTGLRFHDWLASVRIAKAKGLFESGNLTVTKVADLTGFRDLGTFERTFKRHTGATPRDYKKAVRPA